MFTDQPAFHPPADLQGKYTLAEDEKAIINPGSVGQPRDLDPRASYDVIDDDRVRFIRLEYDIDAVVAKIRSVPELLDWLGERLYEGR